MMYGKSSIYRAYIVKTYFYILTLIINQMAIGVQEVLYKFGWSAEP